MEILWRINWKENEENDKWKISLRANGFKDLSDFAQKFEGGGHKNASGFTFNGKLEALTEKIINELKTKNFQVFGYDPFFRVEFVEKYLKENQLSKLNFTLKNDLSNESLEGIDCICVIQHHDDVENRILEIYEKSLIPFIYDCQTKISKNPKSSTHLDYLGS